MATKTKAPERAIANLPRGQRVPIINPPVAPPPSKAEVVKAMVQLHKERVADAFAKAKAEHARVEKVLADYVATVHAKSCIPKPNAKAMEALMPGRAFISATLECSDGSEAKVREHCYRDRTVGCMRWHITLGKTAADDDSDDAVMHTPWFRAPEPIASEWKALRADVGRAKAAMRDAERETEPPAIAVARRAIEGTAQGPQRARCAAILADPESRQVLERALKAALAPKDVAGHPLVDAETVPA